jgi:hypothetical protein
VRPGIEPLAEDDLLGCLPAGAGLPVPAGGQGLEVDRVGQYRAERVLVLVRESLREALTWRSHQVPPAVISS